MVARGAVLASLLIAGVALAAPALPTASTPRYETGNPTFREIHVSPSGKDTNDGSKKKPLQTLAAAWKKIDGVGWRINLGAGSYSCEGGCPALAERKATGVAPIVIRSADGRGTAKLLGELAVSRVEHLHLLDLEIKGGVRVEDASHLLVRGVVANGALSIERSDDVAVEECDLGGLELAAVRRANVLASRIHGARDACVTARAGSVELFVEGNELRDCTDGIRAGGGSNLGEMRTPYLHYEVYGLTFVNNVIDRIKGTPLVVAGGYDVLLAHNTIVDVGLPFVRIAHGSRGCQVRSEVDDDALDRCVEAVGEGGWGPPYLIAAQDYIPNKNVHVLNNVFYDARELDRRGALFAIAGSIRAPKVWTEIPSPARADDNLVIRGNVVWSGFAEAPLGVESDDPELGCRGGDKSCSAGQLRADNAINDVEPAMPSPQTGDYRLKPGSAAAGLKPVSMPTFVWNDLPPRPEIPKPQRAPAIVTPARPGAY